MKIIMVRITIIGARTNIWDSRTIIQAGVPIGHGTTDVYILRNGIRGTGVRFIIHTILITRIPGVTGIRIGDIRIIHRMPDTTILIHPIRMGHAIPVIREVPDKLMVLQDPEMPKPERHMTDELEAAGAM